MIDFHNLAKPQQIQVIALAAFFWFWFFVLAPMRAFKVGLAMEDPPIFFKMRPYQWIRTLALLLALYLGMIIDADLQTMTAEVFTESPLGAPLALGLTLVLFFLIPEMTARGRIQREDSAGEWLTPMLVLFRWGWLGVVMLGCVNFWQFFPYMDEILGRPLNPLGGVFLPLVGVIVYLLWWGLPSALTAKLADEGEPHAIYSLPRVRWWGLPVWLRFLMQRGASNRMRKEGNHKLCPTCMQPIDNIEAYESLRFDTCPNCGELVPPAYQIEEYITHFADRAYEILGANKEGGNRKASKRSNENDVTQRLMRAVLTMGVRERATDLHLLSESGQFLVRARVDGILFTMLDLPEELLRHVISIVKVQSNLDIAEKRKPQDGSFKTTVDEKKLDVRVNTSPSSTGETAALRLLYRQDSIGSLEKLGMSRRNYRIVKEYITRPHGLILVTGPTGSGKSTTLYNALTELADGRRNIITLEDPIEYEIEKITQTQVNSSKDLGFATGLRNILRQDPDVIMIGEIRDTETAKMAIDAAMTGHLVFSTLHTIDTATTIGRLMDLGVDPHRHADALTMIMAQRLVRSICELCSENWETTGEQLSSMGLSGAPEKIFLKRGRGCPRCHDTGYYGREGIYELLMPDDHMRELISSAAMPADIRREARAQGMRTLLEDGLTKAVLGRTTIDEVLRVTS